MVGDGGNHFTNGSIFPGGHTTYLENNMNVHRPGNGTVFSNALYTDKMIENIEATPKDGKPLLMYLAFQAAHSPFMTPPGTLEKYDQIYGKIVFIVKIYKNSYLREYILSIILAGDIRTTSIK